MSSVSHFFFLVQVAFFCCLSPVWKEKLENVWHAYCAFFVMRPTPQKKNARYAFLCYTTYAKKKTRLAHYLFRDLRHQKTRFMLFLQKKKRDLRFSIQICVLCQKTKKLFPTLKLWGPPRRHGLRSQSTHLWATAHFLPRYEALGTPYMVGVM